MSHSTSGLAPVKYETELIRLFTIMTVVWGIVGMGIGVFIASQLAWPALNFDIEWISFGRLRPLHTNAVIFAFVQKDISRSTQLGNTKIVRQYVINGVLVFHRILSVKINRD